MIRRRVDPQNVFEFIMVYGDESRFRPKLPAKPTKHRPGSAEKVEVLRRRVEAGESLWHPDDETVLSDRPNYATDAYMMRKLKATMQVRVRSAI